MNIKSLICLSIIAMYVVFPFIEDVQSPNTSIVDPPTIISDASVNPVVIALRERERPASAILVIEPGLTVSNAWGLRLNQVLRIMEGRVIPIFRIEDASVAAEFIEFYNQSYIMDGILMSSNPEILNALRTDVRFLQGALAVDGSGGIDKTTLDHWAAEANSNFGRIIYIYEGVVSREDISYLQARMFSVWVDMSDDYFSQILNAPNGIVTGDVSRLYSALEAFDGDKPVLLRTPFNVAHRGSPSIIPQNTLEGAVRAFADGADILELDIQITSDHHLVVFHDFRVGALTGCPLNRYVWEMTLEEIQELTPNRHGSYAHSARWNPDDFTHARIPTLREFLEEFSDTTGRNLIFAEIKDAFDTPRYTRIIQELRILLDEFDMHDQFVFITFNHSESKFNVLQAYLPHVPLGGLDSRAATAEALIREHAPHNMFPNRRDIIGGHYIDRYVIQALNHRGMPYAAWTFRDTDTVARCYLSGIAGITNSHAHLMSDIPVSFTPYADSISLKVGEATFIEGFTTDRHGVSAPVYAEGFAIVSGGEFISIGENGDITGISEGTAVVIPLGRAYVGERVFLLPGASVTVVITME